MKKIALLGCTGSIGSQTLDVVRAHPDQYQVCALSCGSNANLLLSLSREFCCDKIGIFDKTKYSELAASGKQVFAGDDALTFIVDGADIVVVAVVGMVGLKAVLYALGKGLPVALANKESLVAGGELVKKIGGALYPVDSEHSAVWQCLQGERDFKRIILTASGGPFRTTPIQDLKSVTPERAVAHPNWRMGKKISVDSATMFNKGLEIIEARWLFDTTAIDYIIHPQSVVHSMVEFADGSIKAQAGFPDMRLPIQYALSYPEHAKRNYTPLSLPLFLEFFPPDEDKFPAPKLAKYAIEQGGDCGAILNAADEAAVRLFLQKKICFTDIVKIVESALAAEPVCRNLSVDGIFETHNRVYNKIYSKYRGN